MPSILIDKLTDKEKKRLDIIKAEIGTKTWKELLIKGAEALQGGRKHGRR